MILLKHIIYRLQDWARPC